MPRSFLDLHSFLPWQRIHPPPRPAASAQFDSTGNKWADIANAKDDDWGEGVHKKKLRKRGAEGTGGAGVEEDEEVSAEDVTG